MRKKLASKLAVTATLAALMGLLAVKFDSSHSLVFNSAMAGNGHGNGGGNGNAGGNGNGNGNGDGSGSGNSNAHPTNNGEVSSSLGALNAAHASTTALANASPKSRTGKIAAYKADSLALTAAQSQLAADTASLASPAVIAADNDAIAAAALAKQAALNAAANKTPVSAETQAALDSMLGL
jgi:hypothetical protein